MDAKLRTFTRWLSRLLALGIPIVMATQACLVEIREPVEGTGGTSTTTSSMGGADGGGGASGGSGGSAEPCPTDMVHVQHATFPDVSFCIDRTEVTRARYVAFLIDVEGDVANTQQPSECAFNTSLTTDIPGSFCPTFSDANDLPVNCIDWCDAYAYCAWADKRLCGALDDGGPLAFDALVSTDEWHFACSAALQQTYPYGDDPEVCACYVPQEWQETMMCDYQSVTSLNNKVPVGSQTGCEGGFPGIFDMQGNASEWTNRCQPGNGDGEELCVTRGGHTYGVNGSTYYRCDLLAQTLKRNEASIDPGVRCCRDANPL